VDEALMDVAIRRRATEALMRSSRTIRTRRTLMGALAVTSVFAFGACGEGTHRINDFCPNKVNGTGGDPTGKWGVSSYCQIDYPRTASPDWCSQLVLDQSGVHDGLFLGTVETKLLTPSWINFRWEPVVPKVDPNDPTEPDRPCGPAGSCGTYEAALVFGGPTTTVFPMGCLRQHQVDPTCGDLQLKMRMLIQNNVNPTIFFNQDNLDDPRNIKCVDQPGSDACACSYTVTTAGVATDLGAWRLDGDLLMTFPGVLAQAGAVDYFVDVAAGTMSMHGHDGMPLLAHDPVRSLELVRCDDAAMKAGTCPCEKDASARGVCVLP
jgi:hypothetical protein